MKNLKLLAIGIFAGLNVFSQADVAVNPNLSFNGESNLIVNPLNNDQLVTAWMKVVSFSPLNLGMAVSHSNDAGQSWSTPIMMPHYNTNNQSADPTMAYDKNGNLFLTYIDYRTSLDSAQVYITKSSNHGLSWSTPVEIVNNFASPDFPIDRPWMAIDNSNGPYSGNIYVVTKSYKSTPMPHHVWSFKSSDGGLTWTTPKLVDDSIPTDLMTASMGAPAVTADGKLYIAYMSYHPSASLFPRYVFVKSTDGGSTFTYHQLTTLPANAGFAAADSLYQFSYNLSANPTNALNLILVTTDNRNGDPDILAYHTQNGNNFSALTRVNDDFIGTGIGQEMCWSAFNRFGTYTSMWRDRRNGVSGQNSSFQVFGAYSMDGGLSYSANLPIQITPSPVVSIVDGNDFIGVAIGDTCIFSTWLDRRNTTSNQLYFNKTCAPQIIGVTTFNKELESKIFPNPTNKYVDVEAPSSRIIKSILVRDLQGELIVNRIQLHHKLFRVNLERFDAGFYQMEIIFEDGKIETAKLVVTAD